MKFIFKPNRNAWLWWISIIALSLGLSIFVLLKPSVYDVDIQRLRSTALIAGIFISGLCVIIGTSRRWFGKDL